MKFSNYNSVQQRTYTIFVVLCYSLVSACQSSSHYSTVDTKTLDEIQQALIYSQAQPEQSTPEKEIFEEFIPKLEIDINSESVVEERFNFLLNGDMDVKEFFPMLTEGTQYSIVVHPGITGSISALDLKNVTLEETLEQISALYGFAINKNGTIFQVLPGGLQTKMFKVDYLNVARNGSSNMQIVASGITQGNQNGNNLNNNNGTNGFQNNQANFNNLNNLNNAQNNNGNNQTSSSGGASISTNSEADYWSNLEEIISSIVNAYQNTDRNSENNRSVIVSPHTGLIIVRAYPNELTLVSEFLDNSQNILQKQVILEAKILEVELKEGFQSGIDLEALGEINGGNTISLGYNFIGDQLSGISSSTDIGYKSSDFNSVIHLLETQGNVQVISSPRISTLNNQKAVFKVGSEQYFLTNANSTSFGSGDTATTNQNTSLQPFFSGIAFDVTPQISDQGDIILHIHPILSQVQEDVRIIAGEEFPLANSTTRESDSVARARNGEVIVISGLMQTRSRAQDGGMPGVRKIPLFGNAFEQKQKESTKTELVILLRAIVDGESAMQNAIAEHMQGFDQIKSQLTQ